MSDPVFIRCLQCEGPVCTDEDVDDGACQLDGKGWACSKLCYFMALDRLHMDRITALEQERDELKRQMGDANSPATEALNQLWQLLYPGKDDWEYPGMVLNHIRIEIEERDELRRKLEACHGWEIGETQAGLTDIGVLLGVDVELWDNDHLGPADWCGDIENAIKEIQAERDELRKKLEAEEKAHTQEIETRDRLEEIADQLAHKVAGHEGLDIGEHSNRNCPWQNAIDGVSQEPE